MTTSKEIKKATDLIYFLASTKEREINSFVDKLLDLKRAWMQNPNSINELRYNLALERYGRLQKDTVDLTRLEKKIVQINNDLDLLRTESA
ncbi:hypothetical protein [Winogradskyella flava]|uniref:hypothetical protein n=1 Tax=Winogradskyella flava TaxID=1884876 RepID=UPI002493863D|nr:hypothetical protein [Winogradskyella flava]